MKRLLLALMAVVVLTSSALVATPVSAQSSPKASPKVYAALGDSVAGGLGLPPAANPIGNAIVCGRSPQSYPHMVARSVKMPLRKVACSGATVGDLFTKQAVEGPDITAQLDTAFVGGTPGLISITAGANDAHWADFIRTCYVTDCANFGTTFLANSYLVVLQAKLHVAFSSIYFRSNGNPPKVIMTGYYNPLSAACAQQQQNITPEEITWLTAETQALNQTIRDVASLYSFVRFAPVDFSGHDICSATPWVQSPADPAPFHPTAVGQRAIGTSVIQAVNR